MALNAMTPMKVSITKPSTAGIGLRIDHAEKFIDLAFHHLYDIAFGQE